MLCHVHSTGDLPTQWAGVYHRELQTAVAPYLILKVISEKALGLGDAAPEIMNHALQTQQDSAGVVVFNSCGCH